MKNTKQSELELYPPYVIIYNKIRALFDADPDLEFSLLDDETRSATVSSSNKAKLKALEKALNTEAFAKLGFTLNFEYEGAEGETADFIMTLFRGNPHFSNVNVVEEAGTGVKHTLCYFKDETIQYSADDRFVPGGYRTTLAESLVAELFNSDVRHMKYITEPKAMFDDFEDDYCPCAEYCAGCCKEDIFE